MKLLPSLPRAALIIAGVPLVALSLQPYTYVPLHVCGTDLPLCLCIHISFDRVYACPCQFWYLFMESRRCLCLPVVTRRCVRLSGPVQIRLYLSLSSVNLDLHKSGWWGGGMLTVVSFLKLRVLRLVLLPSYWSAGVLCIHIREHALKLLLRDGRIVSAFFLSASCMPALSASQGRANRKSQGQTVFFSLPLFTIGPDDSSRKATVRVVP